MRHSRGVEGARRRGPARMPRGGRRAGCCLAAVNRRGVRSHVEKRKRAHSHGHVPSFFSTPPPPALNKDGSSPPLRVSKTISNPPGLFSTTEAAPWRGGWHQFGLRPRTRGGRQRRGRGRGRGRGRPGFGPPPIRSGGRLRLHRRRGRHVLEIVHGWSRVRPDGGSGESRCQRKARPSSKLAPIVNRCRLPTAADRVRRRPPADRRQPPAATAATAAHR